MSQLSEIIIPSGVVLLAAWAIKKYFDTWQPDTWVPNNKTCIGPICWATYGSGSPALQQIPTQQPYIPPTGPATFTGTTNTGSPCSSVGPLDWWLHPECWAGGSWGW